MPDKKSILLLFFRFNLFLTATDGALILTTRSGLAILPVAFNVMFNLLALSVLDCVLSALSLLLKCHEVILSSTDH